MSRSPPTPNRSLLTQMDAWPDSWALQEDDIAFGKGLVAEFRPFVVHLQSLGLAPRTVRKHLDNLWVIGGEIVRRLDHAPEPRGDTPLEVLLEAIDIGEAPLVHDATEAEQRGFDATARRLYRFLTGE